MIVTPADWKFGSHACVPICHAWWKSLSHYSINWHILIKYINYLDKPEPNKEKKSLCGWSTFSEFSFISREVNVPLFVLDGTLRNIFGTSSDIFGYHRTLTKNLGTLKIKNLTPINVKRLAGIKCLQQFYLSPRKHLLKSIHITELFSAIKSRKPGSEDLKA